MLGLRQVVQKQSLSKPTRQVRVWPRTQIQMYLLLQSDEAKVRPEKTREEAPPRTGARVRVDL